MDENEDVTISENLLNLFVQTIAENVTYAKAQPVFQQMAFELSDNKNDKPQIVTSS